MAKEFRPYNMNQPLLFETDIREWLPEDHIAFFISEIVESTDLSDIYTQTLQTPHTLFPEFPFPRPHPSPHPDLVNSLFHRINQFGQHFRNGGKEIIERLIIMVADDLKSIADLNDRT